MFCIKCGNQLIEGSSFCNKCGTPISVSMMPTGTGNPKQSTASNDQRLNKTLLAIGMSGLLIFSALCGVLEVFLYQGYYDVYPYKLIQIKEEFFGRYRYFNTTWYVSMGLWVCGILITVYFFYRAVKDLVIPVWPLRLASLCEIAAMLVIVFSTKYMSLSTMGWIVLVAACVNIFLLTSLYSSIFRSERNKAFKKAKICPYCNENVVFGSVCPKCGSNLH